MRMPMAILCLSFGLGPDSTLVALTCEQVRPRADQGTSTYLMPAPERVAANACSHASSGTASESSAPRSTCRCLISSSARSHDAGVDALPDVIVSSLKHVRSNGTLTGFPARPI